MLGVVGGMIAEGISGPNYGMVNINNDYYRTINAASAEYQILPKVHNLVFLIEKIGLQLPEELQDALFELNRVSIPTRYPEDLRKMSRMYSRKRTENGLKVQKIILFGSHVHGAATSDSDIDVVIVSDNFRKKSIFTRARLTKEAEIQTIRKFMIPLDIITMTPEEMEDGTSAIANFARKGELLFQA